MSHIVNRRDLDFLLYEVLDLELLLQTSRYCAYDRASINDILDSAQTVAEKEYLPLASMLDANEPRLVDGKVQMMPEVRQALGAYADLGLFAAGFDEQDGGMQLPWVVNMMINGMFSCANMGIANYATLTIANANLLNAFGSDAQKHMFLAPMLAGRWFGTMCLSEPQAGSSLSDIRSRAEALGDDRYRIVGSKTWISGGEHELSANIVHMVLAKVPGGPKGVKGISLFVVPRYRVNTDGSLGDWNNVALVGLNHKMGHRGTTNCLLNFGEGGDCIGFLIGEPHRGLQYMFHMMNEARIGVGHGAVMSALGGYLYSLEYARNRTQGRHPRDKNPDSPQIPIVEHADVRRMLMSQKAAVEGGLALVAYCSMLVDQQRILVAGAEHDRIGQKLDVLTPIVKSWPSERCLEANKLAIQVLGGCGYMRDFPVERMYRDNRLNHIHEGTHAIHGLDLLGRKVRMADGLGLKLVMSEIRATLKVALRMPSFAEEARDLSEALRLLEATTKTILSCEDLNLALANATVYLDAFGDIVIAWMWLWQGIAAMNGSGSPMPASADTDFYEGKIKACRYFFRYELPRAVTQLTLVGSLDDICLGMRPEQYVGV